MSKRTSFLDEPLPDNGKRHLRIIITDSNDDNEFLTVPVDTLRSRFQDKSCLIQPNEHNFIKEQSFVNYKYARVLNFATVFNGLQKGILIKKEDISTELLKRIQNGAKVSKQLDIKFQEWFNLF